MKNRMLMKRKREVQHSSGNNERFDRVKNLIEVGVIKDFPSIFKFMPKTPLAKALKISLPSFTKKMHNPKKFEIEEIERMASLFQVSFEKMLELILKAGK